MLGKLIRHELKATARYFLPLFLIAIALTPITRFTLWIGNYPPILQFIPTVIVFLYVATLIIVASASILLIIHRFYKSMVTDEGYLMHTLPVSTESHIISKLTVASIWTVSSWLVIFISIFGMFYTSDLFSVLTDKLSYAWFYINTTMNSSLLVLFIIEFLFMFLFGIFTSPLIYYAAIALGQVISKNKILGAIIGYFIIQIASQIIGVIVMVPLGVYGDKLNESANSILAFFANFFFPIMILFAVFMQLLLFGITDYIFKKKLNLE
ncbi:hypothetical protein RZO55_18105 [Clostridium boliviensis]|uniref:ABC transporter permease n=1 Tax=Clostridium boliviensis TaxID=318465 RepID=A0ABU4GPD0_9CLOT|nr:hypothetical protein [Clostridium boliviensis]MDW2799490.1 hypothetical protein [Clostridium boliviensis]